MHVFCFPSSRLYPWVTYFHKKKTKIRLTVVITVWGLLCGKEGGFVRPYLPISWMLSWKTSRILYGKGRVGKRGSFKKTEGSEKAARVRLLCWELGRSKRKIKPMCKVSHSTEIFSSISNQGAAGGVSKGLRVVLFFRLESWVFQHSIVFYVHLFKLVYTGSSLLLLDA